MTAISMNSSNKQRNIRVAWLLIASYLLALVFTVSHNHQSPEDFRAELSLALSDLNLKEHVGHWHSDQHHSASCQLISQTPASFLPWSIPVIHNSEVEVQSAESLPRAFPATKRLTRAPPVLS